MRVLRGVALVYAHCDRRVEQSYYSWLGDVCVVGRALSVDEFMLA